MPIYVSSWDLFCNSNAYTHSHTQSARSVLQSLRAWQELERWHVMDWFPDWMCLLSCSLGPHWNAVSERTALQPKAWTGIHSANTELVSRPFWRLIMALTSPLVLWWPQAISFCVLRCKEMTLLDTWFVLCFTVLVWGLCTCLSNNDSLV